MRTIATRARSLSDSPRLRTRARYDRTRLCASRESRPQIFGALQKSFGRDDSVIGRVGRWIPLELASGFSVAIRLTTAPKSTRFSAPLNIAGGSFLFNQKVVSSVLST